METFSNETDYTGKYLYIPTQGYIHVKRWEKRPDGGINFFGQGFDINHPYLRFSFECHAVFQWYMTKNLYESAKGEFKEMTRKEFLEKFKELTKDIYEKFEKEIE